MAAPLPASSSPQQHVEIVLSPTVPSPASGMPHPTTSPPLCIQDLRAVAVDIKDTLSAAIADLRHELHAITGRVQKVENATMIQHTAIKRVAHKLDSHTLQLRDIQRHVVELDNRGRRHNLRIRGLLESIETDQIAPAVTGIFNGLLDKPPDAQIDMERIHRAFRPRGRDTSRDIICFVNDYEIKENVLKNARERDRLDYNGHPIQIFQDLSAITLKNRRDLRPLLEVLRTKGIHYRWKFPFSLLATHQGRSALLRVPEELEAFCKHLDLPYIHLPDWYAEFQVPELSHRNLEEEPMEAQDTRY